MRSNEAALMLPVHFSTQPGIKSIADCEEWETDKLKN